MNLISNAAEAMTGGGTIVISTKHRYIDKPIRGYDNVNEGDYAVLIVSDMIMDPNLDGLETYRHILTLHPDQKAIIVSGFSDARRVRSLQKLGAGEYVKKPHLMEKLGAAGRNELDRDSRLNGD